MAVDTRLKPYGIARLKELHRYYGNLWMETQQSFVTDMAQQYQTALYFYHHGDMTRAFAWYSKSAVQGYADAQFNLALFYLHGVEVPPSRSNAKKWLQAAAKNGSIDAMRAPIMLSVYGPAALRMLPPKSYPPVAIDCTALEQAAMANGNVECKFYLGLSNMLNAMFVERRPPVDLYIAAAAHCGHAESLFVMAWWNHFVLKNLETALRLYQTAATLSDDPAIQFHYALVNFDIRAFPRYSSLMARCASAQDYAPAKYHLGMQLLTGKCLRQNIRQGFVLLHSAANRGVQDAMMALGRMHELGVHTVQSKRRAIYWFERAAEYGRSDAMYSLSVIYGASTPQGRQLLEQAARAGYAMAQNDYGTILVKEGSISGAEFWLHKAWQGGDKTAMHNIRLLNEMLGDESASDASGTSSARIEAAASVN